MSQYYYLIASLPMLEFDAKPLISYEAFLTSCREQLNDSDFKILNRATIEPCEDAEDLSFTLREWKRFGIILRNEIAKQRSSRMSKDVTKDLRGEGYSDPLLAASVHWIIDQESPIDKERFLDKIRWEKIEELARGHYFDMDFLITYALKLQILRRWQTIDKEGGMQILENLVAG